MRNFDLDDLMLSTISAVLILALVFLIAAGGAMAIDAFVLERSAFTQMQNCRVKRMEPVRKFLSTQTVCVPAYRETKNDTVTVNGLSRVTP